MFIVLKGKIIDKSCHCGEKDSKSLLFYSSTKTLRQCRANLLFTKLSTESDQLYSRKKKFADTFETLYSLMVIYGEDSLDKKCLTIRFFISFNKINKATERIAALLVNTFLS